MRNLITAQEVIDLAFAENSNMMAESISDTAIRIAEIKYIRPAFGVMYPLLADKYADFTNDYVKPALAYFVKCEIVSSIAIDMSNSGVAVANPQYQSAATDKQRQRLYDSEMSKAKTLLDFALSYIAENKESFPDFSGDAPKKHHRVGGILLGGGTSRSQSASITGDAFKAEFDKYIKEMGETAEKVEQLIESTGAITEEVKGATNNAILATVSANKATENANKAGAEAVRIATESANKATTAKENAEQATEQAKEATANANSAAQRANEEVQNLREKADTDGYYPDMTVGKADNLVGRGDTQDATINFRPSGGVPGVGNGMNITDGAARIKAIKGNSVVVNQRLATLFSPSATGNTITNNGITFTKENDGYFHVSGSNTSGKTAMSNNSTANYNFSIGHKYLFLVDGIQKSIVQAYLLTSQTSHGFSENGIITAVANENILVRIIVRNSVVDVDERVRCAVIDLTQMFGAGNEPATVNEYHQRKPINIANEYAYKEGTILDMNVSSLVSTSDNAFNPETKEARVMGGEAYTITADVEFGVLFLADGEDENEEQTIEANSDGAYIFPTNGVCYPDTIKAYDSFHVCLKHSYEKSHFVFQQDKKDFSFIREIVDKDGETLFPNGMRSAGIAYDEIKYNPTKKCWVAVKRIADVELSSLNWLPIPDYSIANFKATATTLNIKATDTTVRSNIMCVPYITTVSNANVAESKNDKTIKLYTDVELRVQDLSFTDVETFKQSLQGVTLYYELATPIERDIPNSENWNLDYLVWDFGTEEALVRDSSIENPIPSAPFRADINYEPNAVDDIRYANKKIAELESQIASLVQTISTMQTTNIEE